ncbi:DnaJ family domain-containing protein [Aquisalimonas sp.]|uniref:DnaJ family domain-containing protein n=1 Tax=unclassified Aquisalimonas TaxID=2644645 RepID=UPI0025B8AA82|nr:DnaJ family domain-containing protein [Aquisalimonas sp.]
MHLLDQLAEQRIAEARERGELSNLAGEGARQVLDDDSLVPEHLRAAYRVLRNAGYLPPEVQTLRDIERVEDLLAQLPLDDAPERDRAQRRLQLLRMKLQEGRRGGALWTETAYHQRLLARLDDNESR